MSVERPTRLTDLLSREFLARLDALDVLSRRILQGKLQGERRSKRRGQSVEFADHRPYVAGDDLRFIDWNTYARLEQLFLKLFLEEQDLTVHILLDTSASMGEGEPPKLLAAQKLTAALGYVSLVNNNRLMLWACGEGVVAQATGLRGRPNIQRLADFVLARRAEGPGAFDQACRQIEQSRGGAGVMVVISDFFHKEGFEAGLKRLSTTRYSLYAIQMLSPQELAPDLAGDLSLLDVEDGDCAEVTVNAAVLDYYKRTLNAYCATIRNFCTRRGGQYVLASSADPVEPLVLGTLRRRGLVQ